MGTLSINGVGTVNAVPNQASVMLTVETHNIDTNKAIADNNSQMAILMQKLKDFGIEGKQIRTTNFSVMPIYKAKKREIESMRVSNQIHVHIMNLTKLGEILTAAGELSLVGSLSFSNSDIDNLMNNARVLAIKNAIEKAQIYCGAAGIALNGINDINENVVYPHAMRSAARAASFCGESLGGSVPTEAGSQDISVNVFVNFDINSTFTKAEQAQ